MTQRSPENGPTWLVDWGLMATAVPPRHPDDDDEAEDEDGDAEPDDDLDPAVVREPDE
jgi:hypothetical protein